MFIESYPLSYSAVILEFNLPVHVDYKERKVNAVNCDYNSYRYSGQTSFNLLSNTQQIKF